jgi:hypothetical protein
MMINHADYFAALGYRNNYYNPAKNEFDSSAIIDKIKEIQERWKDKYPNMQIRPQHLRFDNLLNFDHSFTTELVSLNMEAK